MDFVCRRRIPGSLPKTRRLLRRVCLLSLNFFVSIDLYAADETARIAEVLARMSSAMRELNYQGLFTFEFGSTLDTYKVVHRLEGNQEFERLEKLNGSQREIVRSGRETNCLSQGDQLLRGLLRGLSASNELFTNYRFNFLADDRVAGRDTMMLEILPRDEYRYGYFLGIDKATGLPTKALLLGPKQTILERFQFVDLEVGESEGLVSIETLEKLT